MTNPNYTHATLILDESGSMGSLRDDVIGGFNSFLRDQKAVLGRCDLVVRKFSTGPIRDVYAGHVVEAPSLDHETYRPGGGTALFDAVADTITRNGRLFAGMAEQARPGKVLVVVYTDGEENASGEYAARQDGAARLKVKIEEQKSTYNWEFLFIGSELASVLAAQAIGINNAFRYENNSRGVGNLYAGVSSAMTNLRTVGVMNATQDSFTPENATIDLGVPVPTP